MPPPSEGYLVADDAADQVVEAGVGVFAPEEDLPCRVQPQAQRWVEAFNCLVAIAFTAGMVWYGWDVVDVAVLLDQRSSSDLQFPIWIYYLALPVGGGLMLIRYLVRLYAYLFRFDPRVMTIGHSIEHEAPPDLALPPR